MGSDIFFVYVDVVSKADRVPMKICLRVRLTVNPWTLLHFSFMGHSAT